MSRSFGSWARLKNMVSDIFLKLPGDTKLPALGYGTWQFQDNNLEKPLDVALEVGYRHIDTAYEYFNEHIIGKVLKKWFDSGKLKREDVFVTTKLSFMNMHPDMVEANLKESLQKLQLDYVDQYLMHFPLSVIGKENDFYADPNFDFLDVWKKMEEQQESGKAKFIGVSNFSVKKLERLRQNCKIKPVSNQVEMHLYLQQKELLEYCNKNDIKVIAYSPLGCRVYNNFLDKLGKPRRVLSDMFEDPSVKGIAEKYSKTSAQIALRFLLQLGVALIPKSVTPDRVRENFDVFDFALDDEDMAQLRLLDKGEDGRVWDWKETARFDGHPDYEF